MSPIMKFSFIQKALGSMSGVIPLAARTLSAFDTPRIFYVTLMKGSSGTCWRRALINQP
jgi:hypothetical protein